MVAKRLARAVLAVAAVVAAAPDRGFLLVATNLPVALLNADADANWRADELGCVLRDICSQTTYPATVVVGNISEQAAVTQKRPCDRIVARVLPFGRRLNLREDGSIFPMRLFKVRAIAAFVSTYKDGVLYIDNDVQLRLPVLISTRFYCGVRARVVGGGWRAARAKQEGRTPAITFLDV